MKIDEERERERRNRETKILSCLDRWYMDGGFFFFFRWRTIVCKATIELKGFQRSNDNRLRRWWWERERLKRNVWTRKMRNSVWSISSLTCWLIRGIRARVPRDIILFVSFDGFSSSNEIIQIFSRFVFLFCRWSNIQYLNSYIFDTKQQTLLFNNNRTGRRTALMTRFDWHIHLPSSSSLSLFLSLIPINILFPHSLSQERRTRMKEASMRMDSIYFRE